MESTTNEERGMQARMSNTEMGSKIKEDWTLINQKYSIGTSEPPYTHLNTVHEPLPEILFLLWCVLTRVCVSDICTHTHTHTGLRGRKRDRERPISGYV